MSRRSSLCRHEFQMQEAYSSPTILRFRCSSCGLYGYSNRFGRQGYVGPPGHVRPYKDLYAPKEEWRSRLPASQHLLASF